MNRYIEGITKYSLPHPFRAEAERLANQFDTNTYKQDGVIRWRSKYSLPHPFRAEAERLANQFDTNTYKQDGVIRWRSNNSVPPEEVLEFWKYI